MAEVPLLRTSERSTFQSCVQKWWWGSREGLVPRKADSGARWFGTGIHLCLAEWYVPGTKRGRPLLDTWEQFTKDTFESVSFEDSDGEKQWIDAKALGVDMLTNYHDTYGDDETWEVLQPEQRFSTGIPHPDDPATEIIRMVGTMDLVIRDHSDGKIKVIDHKTAAAIITGHLVLDNQKGTYSALATHSLRADGIIGPREAVHGMLYNFLRKGMRDTRPWSEAGYHNKPTKAHYAAAISEEMNRRVDESHDKAFSHTTPADYIKKTLKDLAQIAYDEGLDVLGDVSKSQPPPLLQRHWEPMTAKERNRTIKRIGEEALVMDEFRQGYLPIIKNTSRECTWCDFFDLCQVDEAGGDVDEMKERAFTVKDPYFDHRAGAGNSKTSVNNDTTLRKGL